MMESKELKTKIYHAHSLILSLSLFQDLKIYSHAHSLILSLVKHLMWCDVWVWASALQPHTITHSHTMLITCTCCDENKGTQDKDFSYSFSILSRYLNAVERDWQERVATHRHDARLLSGVIACWCEVTREQLLMRIRCLRLVSE